MQDCAVKYITEKQKKCAENADSGVYDEKKMVGELVFKVLSGEICVREALQKFPCDIKDGSIQCAWHALIHLEADEDFRKKDNEYAQEQDNYIQTIADILINGDSLPKNILNEYNKYYSPVIKSKTETFINKIKSVFRFVI